MPKHQPRWAQLRTALDGVPDCLRRRPAGPLDKAAEYHRRLAEALRNLGAALYARSRLRDALDQWNFRRGPGSYARALLQFAFDPTPENVGRLLSQDASDPQFFDDMSLEIEEFVTALLEPMQPPAPENLHELLSAKQVVRNPGFKDWAGSSKATAALVFTDIVDSTPLGNELGNEAMGEVRRAHFKQARELTTKYGGREIKNTGDGLMLAFRTAVDALDFGLELFANTGHERVKIRAGIHVGLVNIEEGVEELVEGTRDREFARSRAESTGAGAPKQTKAGSVEG